MDAGYVEECLLDRWERNGEEVTLDFAMERLQRAEARVTILREMNAPEGAMEFANRRVAALENIAWAIRADIKREAGERAEAPNS